MKKTEKLEIIQEHLEIFYSLRGKMDAETNASNEKSIAFLENILAIPATKTIKPRKKKTKHIVSSTTN